MNILRPNRRKDRNRDAESLQYLKWLLTLPCLICSMLRIPQRSRTTAAHLDGTTGAKGSNWSAVPLCQVEHHQYGEHSEEKLQRRFWGFWGLDKDEALRQLHERFRREKAA